MLLQQRHEIENLTAFTTHLCEQYVFPTERKMHSRLKRVYSSKVRRQMRYLCSGSLSTFRCVIASILTIGGYGSPTRAGISSVFSLFTRKSRHGEAGWRTRILRQWTVNAIPASRIVRRCRRG